VFIFSCFLYGKMFSFANIASVWPIFLLCQFHFCLFIYVFVMIYKMYTV